MPILKSPQRNTIVSVLLFAFGIALLLIFSTIEANSVHFASGKPNVDRPLLDVLKWFVLAFAIYFAGWWAVGGLRRDRTELHGPWWDVMIIVVFGILFRIAMVTSVPIQEIDLYRYIWDGAVITVGQDPYRYSPQTVLAAFENRETVKDREELLELCDLLDERPGLQEVLYIVHFGQYTSPYPPVSQCCFAAATGSCEKRAAPMDYVRAMKWMLVLFDIATGLIVLLLLRQVAMPLTFSIAYWWCPLLIKEIANSGHLDSIATFFIALSVLLVAYAIGRSGFLRPAEPSEETDEPGDDSATVCHPLPAILSALSLAFAVAAKVFPIILVPLWFVFIARRSVIKALLASAIFCAATTLLVWPLARHLTPVKTLLPSLAAAHDDPVADQSGIEAFSKFWEMNDLLFMAVVENLKPAQATFSPGVSDSAPNDQQTTQLSNEPWFRFTSESFRWNFANSVGLVYQWAAPPDADKFTPQHYAFFATRLMSGLTFLLLVCWCCWRIVAETETTKFLEMAFLTIAWFWLLAPTQNPWYWTWAMPLLVFARGRTWFLMSGVLFVYYLRFWFDHHHQETIVGPALQTAYPSGIFDWIFPWSQSSAFTGRAFFDFYLTWYEFGPFLLLLLALMIVRCVRRPDES